ncbi:MAG: alpha/beta hydrolase [Clostridia bacterium]|nr:alpha/beta hydrolase [Clostridia bacterium]
MEKKTFIATDGKEIRYREWKAENPKGLLQISHGMAESLARYEKFAEFMSENGFIVVGDDHRGHGETDGCSGYADGDMFRDTLKDVAQLSQIYKKAYPNLKLVLFGHSFGSFIAQAYIEEYGAFADGFIVGGSAYMNGFAVISGRLVAKTGCFFGKKKKPAKLIAKLSFGAYNKKYKDGTSFISSVKEECDAYNDCKDCGFILSYAFYKSMFCAFKRLYRYKSLAQIDVNKPIFLISGAEDSVGGCGKLVDKLYNTYKKIGVKDVGLKLYDGVRHEYLNDVSRDAARADILDFCRKVAKF